MSKLDSDPKSFPSLFMSCVKKLALLIQMNFLNAGREGEILSANMKKQYPSLSARALIWFMSLPRRLEGNKVIIYSVE